MNNHIESIISALIIGYAVIVVAWQIRRDFIYSRNRERLLARLKNVGVKKSE